MRSAWVVGLAVVLALVVNGCSKTENPPAAPSRTSGSSAMPMGMDPAEGMQFMAMLSGAEEVPMVETKASGQAEFMASADGMEVKYKLTVKELTDVTMCHLHMAEKGANGEDVVWLYPSTTATAPKMKEGVTNGVLAEGTIKADALVGPMKGKMVKDLVDAMKAGNIYVQVHTKTHAEGEIRGQVMAGMMKPMGGM